jgi:DNA-binding IclR family transcriptional regulator
MPRPTGSHPAQRAASRRTAKSAAKDRSPAGGAVSRRNGGVQSFEVGLRLLSLLAHQRRPMKITELAAQAGMLPAKAHRYLASLVRSGYAAQHPESGLYSTGPAALDFSLSCLSTIEPIEIASEAALALCRRTNHTVALSVWGSFGPTVVRWEQPPRPVMVNIGPGSVFPLLESATGRVFAAFYDEAEIRRHLARIEAERAAGGGALPAGAVARGSRSETVEQVRARGMARARDNFMNGLSAFAAPVLDHRGRLVLVMTVLDYSQGWDPRWEGPTATSLREVAAQVSRSLGYSPDANRRAPV